MEGNEASKGNEAREFFRQHVGCVPLPGETTEQTRERRERNAIRLTEAEEWIQREGWVIWEEDELGNATRSRRKRPLWGCIVSVPCPLCSHIRSAARWAIELGDSSQADNLKRIVVAELAATLLPSVCERMEEWEREEERKARDSATGNLNAVLGYPEK